MVVDGAPTVVRRGPYDSGRRLSVGAFGAPAAVVLLLLPLRTSCEEEDGPPLRDNLASAWACNFVNNSS